MNFVRNGADKGRPKQTGEHHDATADRPRAAELFQGRADFRSSRSAVLRPLVRGGAVRARDVSRRHDRAAQEADGHARRCRRRPVESETILPAASALAKRHVAYGAKAEHYPVVGATLLWTLEKGLGEAWTPELATAWTDAYGVLSGYMISEAYGRTGAGRRIGDAL